MIILEHFHLPDFGICAVISVRCRDPDDVLGGHLTLGDARRVAGVLETRGLVVHVLHENCDESCAAQPGRTWWEERRNGTLVEVKLENSQRLHYWETITSSKILYTIRPSGTKCASYITFPRLIQDITGSSKITLSNSRKDLVKVAFPLPLQYPTGSLSFFPQL